jgi:hypothetical protein
LHFSGNFPVPHVPLYKWDTHLTPALPMNPKKLVLMLALILTFSPEEKEQP